MRAVTRASLLFEIDPICEEFEGALRAGTAPRLEERLRGWEGARRQLLFRELLALELHYARERGAGVDLAGYREAFPEYARAITDVARASSGASGACIAAFTPGQRFGDYTIEAELGRGGMGVVYRARHGTLERQVALKVLLSGPQASAAAEERFQREARAVARLHHGNIVPVFEVGDVDGIAYFAMQLIEGGTLADLIDAESRAQTALASPAGLHDAARVDRVVRLHARLARALHYAHERGVVHRDVKPSNVLIDGRGVPWLVDFGLARLGDSDLTAAQDLLGTVRYMPPERFAGEGDARGDLYGLGVTLFEALALRPAYTESNATRLMRAILDTDVPPLRRVAPGLSRDLETVVATALARDPARRYASAEALADDLERCVARLPVMARPVGPVERLGRWALRNRAATAALCLSCLIAVGAAWAATVFRGQRIDIQALSESTASHLSEAESARDGMREALYRSDVQRAAHAAFSPGGVSTLAAILASCVPKAGELDHRGYEWALLRSVGSGEVVDVWRSEFGGSSADWHPEAELVAMCGRGGISLWNSVTGEHVRDLKSGGHPRSVLFSPNGAELAVTDMDGARVFDVATGELVAFRALSSFTKLAWHPSGERLALTEPDVALWDFREGRVASHVAEAGLGVRMDFDPEGARFVYTSRPDCVRVVETEGWTVVHEIKGVDFVGDVDVSPDGRAFAVACRRNMIHVFDLQTGALRRSIARAHDDVINQVRWSHDSARLASASVDSTVKVWDAGTGALVREFLGHEGAVFDVAFSPDDTRVVATSLGGNLRVWDLRIPAGVQTLAVGPRDFTAARRTSWRDKDTLDVGCPRGWTTFDFEGSPPRRSTRVAPRSMAWSRDEGLALAVEEGWARVYDERTGEPLGELEVSPVDVDETFFAWSSDGSVACVAVRGELSVFERRGARFVARRQPTEREVGDFSLNHDGSRITLPAWDTVRVLDVATGALVASASPVLFEVPGHDLIVPRYGDDAGQLAVLHGSRVLLLDPVSLEPIAVLEEHGERVESAVWSPDGARLATAGRDGMVRLFDRAHQATAAWPSLPHIGALAWSPDGRRLAAIDLFGSAVMVFDATVGAAALWPARHSSESAGEQVPEQQASLGATESPEVSQMARAE